MLWLGPLSQAKSVVPGARSRITDDGEEEDGFVSPSCFQFSIVEKVCWEDCIVEAGSPIILRALIAHGAAQKTGLSEVELFRQVVLRAVPKNKGWATKTCGPPPPRPVHARAPFEELY